MKKVMIAVAPVSAADRQIDPEKIAADVYECYLNGASMVHLHVRDSHGSLTPDLSVLANTVKKIKDKCDIVIEISTGGVSNLTIEERCQPCYADFTEANSLNVGSVNLGDSVYSNPISDVKYCVKQILDNKKTPDIEIFELGMIQTVYELTQEFDFHDPILFALVFGHKGEMPATKLALDHMLSYLKETFKGKRNVLWGYTQANRKDWELVKYALEKGADSIRIGFEDSDYLAPNVRAKTNAELIKKLAELVKTSGAEPMTPEEVRKYIINGE